MSTDSDNNNLSDGRHHSLSDISQIVYYAESKDDVFNCGYSSSDDNSTTPSPMNLFKEFKITNTKRLSRGQRLCELTNRMQLKYDDREKKSSFKNKSRGRRSSQSKRLKYDEEMIKDYKPPTLTNLKAQNDLNCEQCGDLDDDNSDSSGKSLDGFIEISSNLRKRLLEADENLMKAIKIKFDNENRISRKFSLHFNFFSSILFYSFVHATFLLSVSLEHSKLFKLHLKRFFEAGAPDGHQLCYRNWGSNGARYSCHTCKKFNCVIFRSSAGSERESPDKFLTLSKSSRSIADHDEDINIESCVGPSIATTPSTSTEQDSHSLLSSIHGGLLKVFGFKSLA